MKGVLFFLLLFLVVPARAGEYFIEAETFKGWRIVEGPLAKSASGLKMLGGNPGAPEAVATVPVKDAGRYHVWVRYLSRADRRAPFRLDLSAAGRVIGGEVFDESHDSSTPKDELGWKSFAVDLPEGDVTLKLVRHPSKDGAPSMRLIDCVLLTMDPAAKPNHLHYGAQTYVRVTLGEGYDKPAYIHIFADHYRAPWYAHWSLGKDGAVAATSVKKESMLVSGQATPWCNITPTIYQDSGAMLYFTSRHGYTDTAPHLKATIEFATSPEESAVVRRYEIDNAPGSMGIYVPPNLETEENRTLLKRDIDLAIGIGEKADRHPWPQHGRKAVKFPLLVTAPMEPYGIGGPDRRVRERELKTLDYFGFNGPHTHIRGAWFYKDRSYCSPDLDKIRTEFRKAAATFKEKGKNAADILFCELMDEPTGQPLELAATLPSYTEAFRAWLRGKGLSPADLLVTDWEKVNIILPERRDEFPALYYYSQLFRTRALADFMAVQGKIAKEAYGADFPVLANLSDGAIYGANFCLQGVNYFEMLDSDDQNAIWGEDWANGASSYQCAMFNVDLMRAAARERGQKIAHHLIAHSRRKPWDVKLKGTGGVARGVKILNNFCYGPLWGSHEGGPWFRSHLWQAQPDTWTAYAALSREIGAVEDLLLPAMPAPAEVALLYGSSSDVWSAGESSAHGFERMHTWMALTHAQVPVDVLEERQIERGMLDGYKVCYLAGPNLTRAAAIRLKEWVRAGGALFLSAGAASRDEFNRPMDILEEVLPAVRGEPSETQVFRSSGRYLDTLRPTDTVRWGGGQAEVLCVKQSLSAKAGAEISATFQDGTPAMVSGGRVTVCGFLPALSYIKTALDCRKEAEKAGHPLTERSYNPWEFPPALRELIVRPAASVRCPVECSHALVDAVFMPGERGVVVPLSNYTLEPIPELTLGIVSPEKVKAVESAVHGKLSFHQGERVEVKMPLGNNDFLMLWFE
ncbi:hypothetical protein OVA24_03760 [Luteolibacter sp. SL250]|uniref:hypothetical protein n=1 Tax=Luteolibacter sp. SL250 TaxID=2995170 RepID=UPI00226EFD3A|nr:hypothetical protein [Luteolibacter sp. SL250]WAC20493.1 hypothetical protein OVA24_03760 [Luteolibacter sp. SL250]